MNTTMERISRFTFVLICSLMLCLPMMGKKSKYRIEVEAPEAHLFNGFGVGVDLVGPIMKVAGGRFSNMEALARANLLEKYFPVFELGIGNCKREGKEQNTLFTTTAPYFRIGADYNLTKKRNGNRLLVGLRYAFTSFSCDYSNPDFKDEVYGGGMELDFKDLSGKMHWAEVVVGLETRLWSIIRLGWNLRYKVKLNGNFSEHGEPWFVPGFGKNGSNTWGGSVNLMFDI